MIHPALATILSQAKAAFHEKLGDNLAHLILYGSQARGTATPESDIDLLLVVRDENALDRDLVGDVTYPFCVEHDCLVSCQWVTLSRYLNEESPFLRNVRREGIVLT